MNRTLSLVALLAATSFAHAGAVNLLTNGGFESTLVSNGSWINTASIAGWTRTAGPGTGFEIRNNVAGAAQEGRNFIELDTNGNTTIAQSLSTLTAGTTYDLSFWYSPREGVAASSNGIDVFWNGLLLDSVTGLGARSGNVWSQYQYQVVAKAGTNVLSFAATGTSDGYGGGLDNVSLSVPEPGSLALTLAGLAVVALLPRRLRRSAEARRAAALASTLTRA
ncbi:MAG: PEP-CTERM sorting domain-containing protein [Burkholderiales bacterium]|nr:MAG: PEP-CTERM sorting domain-containing protein [Burkholderiales bacterium]